MHISACDVSPYIPPACTTNAPHSMRPVRRYAESGERSTSGSEATSSLVAPLAVRALSSRVPAAFGVCPSQSLAGVRSLRGFEQISTPTPLSDLAPDVPGTPGRCTSTGVPPNAYSSCTIRCTIVGDLTEPKQSMGSHVGQARCTSTPPPSERTGSTPTPAPARRSRGPPLVET